MPPSGNRVVVTGGMSGIGAAAMEALAQAGFIPIAVDIKPRSDVAVPQAALRWDEPVDVSDKAQVSTAVAEIERCHGPIAGLVNAAGILGKMHPPDRLRLADCADTIMAFPLFVLAMGWRDSRQEVRQAGSAQAHPDGFLRIPPTASRAEPVMRKREIPADIRGLQQAYASGLDPADVIEGARIAVEIWALPAEGFGRFVAGIAAPLGIGTRLLADGSRPKGFLCEAEAIADADDISAFGGWRAYMAAKR